MYFREGAQGPPCVYDLDLGFEQGEGLQTVAWPV